MTVKEQIIEAIKKCYLEDGSTYDNCGKDNQNEIDHAISLVEGFFNKLHLPLLQDILGIDNL